MKRLAVSVFASILLIFSSVSMIFAGGDVDVSPEKIDDVAQICDLESLAMNVFNFIMAALPFICLFVLFYGAYQWMTSTGDPQKINQAKDTLTYGVIGFLLACAAVLVVLTIESYVLGADFTWAQDGPSAAVKVNLCHLRPGVDD